MNPRKIILPGGSGFLGEALARHFRSPVYEVVILSRNPKLYSPIARYVKWDGKTMGEWVPELEDAFAVINLTGRSVDCRYNHRNKREILESRINATTAIGKAIEQCVHPPKIWINIASATIYRHAEDRDMDEVSGEIGQGFSVDVCKEWEKTFNELAAPWTRKILIRLAMVMGNYHNSVFPVMKRLVRLGLGGKMGNGNQYISWIHVKDFCAAIEFMFHHPEMSGTYNLAAPHPVPNKVFMKMLRDELKMLFGLPAARWMLEIGAWLMGTETELILKSRRAVPMKLLSAGFHFEFGNVQHAVHDLPGKKETT